MESYNRPANAPGVFRFAICAATLAWACVATSQAQAQQDAYPGRPVKLVVGFAPGGIADTIGRLVGQALSESLKQTVVVENRGGASGTIAARAVLNAPADGYTLLVSTTAAPINEAAGVARDISLGKNLVALSISGITPELLAINAKSPVKSLKDLIDTARKKKDGIDYATAGAGTASHIAAEFLFRSLGIKAAHVPHKGGAPALTAVTGGHIELLSISMPPAVSHVKAGTLRGLAVGARQRSAALPDVATAAEQGYPQYDFTSWVGFFAAGATPQPILLKLNAEINKALGTRAVAERMQKIGFATNVADYPATGKMLDAEVAKWKKAVATIGYGKK
ncbi:MAG: Bug family tripartite tricarboxylate transporter substrate binding protein [Beijerinckiaceae bacterium]